jgi:CRISPR/Cas system-associated exonuclease Cas4 (RecB family)
LKKRTIRASEIGTFLYCKRAWWYQSQGIDPANQTDLKDGVAYHRAHGKIVLKSILFQISAWMMLAAAIVVLAVWLAGILVG